MHPSPETQFVAMLVIYFAERIWVLVAKIITFFDKRSVAKKKLLEDKQRKCVPSKTQAKLPIAAGGCTGTIVDAAVCGELRQRVRYAELPSQSVQIEGLLQDQHERI